MFAALYTSPELNRMKLLWRNNCIILATFTRKMLVHVYIYLKS